MSGKHRRTTIAASALVLAELAAGCRRSPDPVAASDPSPAGVAWFEDVAGSSGLAFTHQSGHGERFLLPEIMGGGAALFDMDADGDLDAYLVQSGRVTGGASRPPNRLFRNRGDGRFDDVTAGSGAEGRGYGMGVATGDYDGDGDPDLYVTNLGPNILLRNDGGGRFTDVTRQSGVGDPGWSTSAAFLDFDGDGDLDLYVANYINWSPARELACYSLTGLPDYCSPRNYDAPARDTLYRNERGGKFTDVSLEAGLGTGFGNGLGVVSGDFDADGRLDVYVANDGMPNQLWINRGDGRFEDRALAVGVAVDQDGKPKAGMGVDAIDIDDDADLDLLVVNLEGESDSFFRNEGRFFRDDTAAAGLRIRSRPFTRFGMALVDFDNNGWLDLYQANGRVGLQSENHGPDPYAEPNLLFRGTPAGRFEEVQPRGGTRQPLIATSRAAAFGDVDNDGGVDIVVVNRDGPASLLKNRVGPRGRWIGFRVLEATGGDAIGARLTIRAGSRTLRRDVRTAYSYLAANDPRVHIGLGSAGRVDSVSVRWVDGSSETFGPFPHGRFVVLERGTGVPARRRPG